MLLALLASIVIAVTPKHGYAHSTYVVSFKAPYASSAATHTQYVIGAVNSGDCTRGISSFGKVQSGPYRAGQTVRFKIHYRAGLCVGVFHGVVHWEKNAGRPGFQDRRLGRFGFRVLS